MTEDPFDEFDDDRDGDPFEHRSDEETRDQESETENPERLPGRADGPSTPDGSDADERDPFEYADDENASRSAQTSTDASSGSSPGEGPGTPVDVAADPFGDIDVSRGDPFEGDESPFDQVDIGDIDPDSVWERLTAQQAGETTAVADAGPALEAGPSVGDPEDNDIVVVSKHSFCEGCPHFSAPPDIECTHEGTKILEFVGTDDVRVVNCPVVAEQRELGEIDD